MNQSTKDTPMKYDQPGPWDNEPDRERFEHAGLLCAINRTKTSGALCGYVAVPEGHPLHGVGYSERCQLLEDLAKERESKPLGKMSPILVMVAAMSDDDDGLPPRPDIVFECHGGLTYSGDATFIEPGLWWFGFDCSHCDDATPRYRYTHDYGNEYRDIDYVRNEVRSLAEQLAAVVELDQ